MYLSGLNSNTRYKITVYAENGVSQLSGVESTSDIVIITEPAGEQSVDDFFFKIINYSQLN